MKKKLGDYTVVLVKPDGVEKGIVGELVTRFEKIGLKIAAAKLIWVDKTHVGKHYKDDNQYHKTVGTKTLGSYKKYSLLLISLLPMFNNVDKKKFFLGKVAINNSIWPNF